MKNNKLPVKILALTLSAACLLTGCGPAAPVQTEVAPSAQAAAAVPTQQTAAAEATAPAADPVITLVEARYPEMAPYPQFDPENPDNAEFEAASDKWYDSIAAQRREDGYAASLTDFWSRILPAWLSLRDGSNKVISPVNLYMALAMLAQVTGGDTRQQIFDLLGEESLDHLLQQVNDVWNAQYRNDGATTTVLANSLWLSRDLTYDQDTLTQVSESAMASVYSGVPGSPAMDQAYRDWINAQTDNLLSSQTENLKLSPELVLAIASTVNYRAKWMESFDQSLTMDRVFYGDLEQEVPFLHKDGPMNFFEADSFQSVSLPMGNGGGTLWLLKPREGLTPEDLLAEEDTYEFLADPFDWENDRYLMVHFDMPKFDISAQLDLKDSLESLGITDAFMPEKSDFTPLLREPLPVYLSQASHAVRFAADEEGITAASYVEMQACGAGLVEEEADFLLDRPFLFVLQSPDRLPLFAGVVNQP